MYVYVCIHTRATLNPKPYQHSCRCDTLAKGEAADGVDCASMCSTTPQCGTTMCNHCCFHHPASPLQILLKLVRRGLFTGEERVLDLLLLRLEVMLAVWVRG